MELLTALEELDPVADLRCPQFLAVAALQVVAECEEEGMGAPRVPVSVAPASAALADQREQVGAPLAPAPLLPAAAAAALPPVR